MYDEFDRRGVTVIALSQEDADLARAGDIVSKVPGERRFELVHDLGRSATGRIDRLTTYLVDGDGIVRQVIPQMVRRRVDWAAVLSELDRLGIGTPPDADDRAADPDVAGGG